MPPRKGPWEIRPDHTGEIDEIVGKPDHFHLEVMDDGHVWIGLSFGERVLHVNLVSDRAITIRVEE
jgi:hypothetical protein